MDQCSVSMESMESNLMMASTLPKAKSDLLRLLIEEMKHRIAKRAFYFILFLLLHFATYLPST